MVENRKKVLLMNTYRPEMHWKAFSTLLLVAFCLLISWHIEITRSLWALLDHNVFCLFNLSLEGKPFSQIFWALANIRTADLFGVLFIVGFFLLYILEATGVERRIRISQFLYLCLWGEIGILVSKELLAPCLKSLGMTRVGPSLLYENAVLVSKAIPWLKVKDISFSCFPSDHAIIILQWLFFIFFFCPWKKRIIPLFTLVFFLLPRLFAGAHWASDILVGSIAYVSVIMAFALYTPIYGYTMNFLIRLTTTYPKVTS